MESHEKLEVEFTERIDFPFGPAYAVACNSGTAALHLAIEGLLLPKGSQVIVPEYTMVAVARAVSLAGLRPVFADVDDNYQIDPNSIREKLTPLTSAIIIVHTYGRRGNVHEIQNIAKENGLRVIEDCAEYHGGDLNDSGQSDAYTWSFYRNKIVAGEEGGIVIFRNPDACLLARSLRSQGFTPEHDFLHMPFGHNYRLASTQAAMISESLLNMRENISERRNIADDYDKAIKSRDPKAKYLASQRCLSDMPWVYPVQIETEAPIDSIVAALNVSGAFTRCGFKPLSEQTEYRGHFRHLNAYDLSRRTLYFSLDPAIAVPKHDVGKLLFEIHSRLPAPRTAHG
tara:strand:- start:12990 stop:14018 length:1029 start_codon:yes stop_codon:yes gene_type:complete